MSYRCGIGPGIPGMEPGPPFIRCDKCGIRLVVEYRMGPPVWLLDGKVPRGWKMVRGEDDIRWDYCPKCKTEAP